MLAPPIEMIEMNQTKPKKSTGRGGARPGSGRKKGSANKRTREIADRAAEEGITPLEYMLELMRAPSDHEDPKIQAVRETMRFEAAKAAAPYIHPKLAAIKHTSADGKPLQAPPPIFNITLSTE